MSGLITSHTNVDLNGDLQIHVIDDDTQPAILTILLNINSELNLIKSTLQNLNIWSNSIDGYVSSASQGQITSDSGNIKSIRILYLGEIIVFFQIHNKNSIESFSNSTLVSMGYKISPTFNDIVIEFDTALQCQNGIAWAVSQTQTIYTASSEKVFVFMQYLNLI